MRYRRADVAGGTYFFTVNLADRSSRLLVEHIDELRAAVKVVKKRHPFEILAWVVLPEHMHAIWTLPDGDGDFSGRWALIKSGFSRALARKEAISPSRTARRERGIWQRRYWEHLIRNEIDLQRHVDYVHINPVKHGYVKRAADWPHSSIHRHIERGWLAEDWACEPDAIGSVGERD
jgi:putative transposase